MYLPSALWVSGLSDVGFRASALGDLCFRFQGSASSSGFSFSGLRVFRPETGCPDFRIVKGFRVWGMQILTTIRDSRANTIHRGK